MSTIREQLLTSDPEERIADKRIKPSLLALLSDQAALLKETEDSRSGERGLRTGFNNRREVIEWYQRATVRTLGHIEKKWPPIDCFAETKTLLPALIDAERHYLTPMEDEAAKSYRQLLEATVVQPAFNQAYKDLRDSAKEYVEDSGPEDAPNPESDLEPGKQRYLAMRPGFQSLDRQQHEALTELWGGFDTRDGVLDWAHGLNSPTAGEIDSALSEKIITDDAAMDHLVHRPSTADARVYREWFAAAVLLPAFVDAVRTTDTNELAEAKNDTPTTLRMKGGN